MMTMKVARKMHRRLWPDHPIESLAKPSFRKWANRSFSVSESIGKLRAIVSGFRA